ncbi:MAG: Fic family protein [Nanoarchaeota archaeon]|nr:Fic family protein [Nanoarchaeota archaeon]MBU4299647.1 Fic family protein [Nanoarchaeota archaeon]MBU4452435.1 Fic family protein [Nanoarchaeota archaeon]MCG2723896.1 Fic family protein [archaeon]
MQNELRDNLIFLRIEEKKRRLDNIRPLSKSALEKLKERFVVEWTYNSNAIEGNTLTLNETKLVLERGLTIKGKSLREHFEAINHKNAIAHLESIAGNKESITEDLIKKLHALILKEIDDSEAGIYRSVRVRILEAIFTPPDPLKIPALMSELINWLKNEKSPTVEVAALAHYKLVRIHPFIDGNGRTSRLLMNLILMKNGFPPAVVLNAERKKYCDRLKKADSGDLMPFVNMMAQSVERSLDLYLEALEPSKSGEEKALIPLSEAAKGTPYSAEYLSLLARTGKLGAIKISRNWVISKDELKKYIEKMKK